VFKRLNVVVIFVLAAFAMFAVAACADAEDNPFGTTTPVPAGEVADSGSSEPASSGPDIGNGESKFTGLGCSGCHTTGTDKLIGPGLAGISSKGDDYIRESITDPGSELVDGYSNLMPTSFGDLPASDLDDLVAYLNTLN